MWTVSEYSNEATGSERIKQMSKKREMEEIDDQSAQRIHRTESMAKEIKR